MGLERVDAPPDVHHHVDVAFDELHRGHHLADALTGEILEVAGLENRDHAFLDFLAEQLLLVRRGVLGQRGRSIVDRLGGFENLLGGLFGAADHGAELAIDLGHFATVKALAMQRRDFPLGAADGVVDEVELDLELFALLDLGAIGFQQRLGFGNLARDLRLGRLGYCRVAVAAPGHLGADRAQLGHDLAMHRADVAAFGNRGHRHGRIAHKGLFDTKTFATNRHDVFPPLHSVICFWQVQFNVRFMAEHVVTALSATRTPAINHVGPAFTQNKRYGANQCATGDVVNRNAGSVYQTEVVLTLY